MKIILSRRMRAFLAKWGGLVVASALVLPVAVVGGTYLYANSRVDATLTRVTQEVTINSLVAAGPTPDFPRRVIYRLSIAVYNRTTNAAQVNITDARVFLDEFSLEVVGSAAWQGTVPGNNAFAFEGDIAVPVATYNELTSRGLVDIEIRGNITVTAQYSFVKREASRAIMIQTEGTFPEPSPLSPSGLTASLSAQNQVQLMWNDNSNNAEGYLIERSLDDSFTPVDQNFTTAEGITTYTDTSVVPGNTYFYRVRATHATAGDSNPSGSVSIAVPAASTSPPVSVTALPETTAPPTTASP